MAHTVIGVFDNASEAQQAVERLIDEGFVRDHVDVSSRAATNPTVAPGSDTYGTNYDRSNRNDKDDDSIGGFFKSLFGSDDDSERYSEVARRSSSIVTVHAQSTDQAHRAAEILDEYGAVDIDERASQYGYAADSGQMTDARATDSTASIPIIEEELQVGKRVVQTGGARLRSRIVERPVEEHLRLREERVWVERNAVNRQATDADFAAFKEGTIEITEQAEIPVVAKDARVVEEVSLGKTVEEREETIRDTVRRTEVDVEKLDADEVRNTTTDDVRTSTSDQTLLRDRDTDL